jgi:hypothetical protein
MTEAIFSVLLCFQQYATLLSFVCNEGSSSVLLNAAVPTHCVYVFDKELRY